MTATHSLPTGRKRGRPPDPCLAYARETFPLWSERTRARWAKAITSLQAVGASEADLDAFIGRAKRRNGALNVAKFEADVLWACDQWLAQFQRAGDG